VLHSQFSKTGQSVLPPIGGYHTTLIAAEKSGQQARLMELYSKYVDAIVRRWQDWAGKPADAKAMVPCSRRWQTPGMPRIIWSRYQ
jgi:DNA modification methylase